MICVARVKHQHQLQLQRQNLEVLWKMMEDY
jgi:hypothetical protein